MPHIRVELLKGRTAEQKSRIAADICAAFERHAQTPPESVTVVFQDVDAADWTVAGTSIATQRAAASR